MVEVTGPSGRVYAADDPGSVEADVSFIVGRYTSE